jgi:hypothetical protein
MTNMLSNSTEHSTKGPISGAMGWAQVIMFLVVNFATVVWFQRGMSDAIVSLQTQVIYLNATTKELQSSLSTYTSIQEGSKTDLTDINRRLSRVEDRVFPTKEASRQ